MNMKKVGLFIFTLIILSSFVFAVPDCPLNAPKTYSGTVSYQNSLLSGTYQITAKIGNNFAGSGSVINGNYEIDISPCYGINGVVNFYIGSTQTNEYGSYAGSADYGVTEHKDLTVNSKPTSNTNCGDGIKTSNEVCDTNDFGGLSCSNYGFSSGSLRCSGTCDFIYTDGCSSPSSSSNSGSSGGGGGGGGGGSYTPVTTSSSSTNTNKSTIVLDNKTSSEETGNSAPITGFSISEFAKSSGGIFAIIGIVTILVIGTAVIVSRKKKKPVEKKVEETISEVKKDEERKD
jgi:hypothetical protein